MIGNAPEGEGPIAEVETKEQEIIEIKRILRLIKIVMTKIIIKIQVKLILIPKNQFKKKVRNNFFLNKIIHSIKFIFLNFNLENKKKTDHKIRGRGESRVISSSALIGWEDEDYNQVNKKLIDYGNKYKEIVNKWSSYPSGKKDSRTISVVIAINIKSYFYFI